MTGAMHGRHWIPRNVDLPSVESSVQHELQSCGLERKYQRRRVILTKKPLTRKCRKPRVYQSTTFSTKRENALDAAGASLPGTGCVVTRWRCIEPPREELHIIGTYKNYCIWSLGYARCLPLVSARKQLAKERDRKQAIRNGTNGVQKQRWKLRGPDSRSACCSPLFNSSRARSGTNWRMQSRVLGPIKYDDKHLFKS